MSNICIVQTGSQIELVQLYQASKQFKKEYPNFNLSLVAKRKPANELLFMLQETFTDIFLFETKDFFLEKEKTFKKAITKQQSLLTEINQINFELLINLSQSTSSNYLSSLIQAENKMGSFYNTNNELVLNDKWSQLYYAYKNSNSVFPFNKVDLIRNLLGVKYNYNYDLEIELKNEYTVCITDQSLIKEAVWADILFNLANKSCEKINILGNSKVLERILSKNQLKAFEHKFVHFSELNEISRFNLIARSQCFIGDNNINAHFAAVGNKKSIIFDTDIHANKINAPYSQNTVFVKADSPKVLIINLINNYIDNHSLTKSEHLDLYTNTINNDVLISFNENKHSFSSKETIERFSQIAIYYYLTGKELKFSLPHLNQEAINTFKILADGFDYLKELYQHAIVTTNALLDNIESEEHSPQFINDTIDKLNEIDSLLQLTSKNYSPLQAVTNFFYVNRLNSPGDNIIEVLQNNLISYYDAQQIVEILSDLTNTALGPKIIGNSSNMDI